MNIASDGIKLWVSRVYYALYNGMLFFPEKNDLTNKNIEQNNSVSFNIDQSLLTIIIQGTGRVHILGNPDDFKKNTEVKKFINHAYVAELIPNFISVSDLIVGFREYIELSIK